MGQCMINRLYHLTNVDNCKKILLEGVIRSRKHAIKAPYTGNFVHFNFCPKSPMLWNLYQGKCLSADIIYGQPDAVYIEFDLPSIIFDLNLRKDNSFIVTDRDVSDNLCRMKTMTGDDINLFMEEIANFVDIPEINQVVNTIDANEHPKKGAELMFEGELRFSQFSVVSIGVHNPAVQKNLLLNNAISRLYGEMVIVKHEWYF